MTQDKTYRLLDANLNRAREGLRVIEDTARFLLDDRKLYRSIRLMRHNLTAVTGRIYPSLIGSRDSVADAGRVIREGGRESISTLLTANFRRVEEALRVLEEYSKLIPSDAPHGGCGAGPDAGAQFKSLRYKAYSLEKKVIHEFKYKGQQ